MHQVLLKTAAMRSALRQGMHEVLAPLILALEKEAAAASRADTAGEVAAAAATAEDPETATATVAAARPSPWVCGSAIHGGPVGAATTHPGAAATLGCGSSPEDLEADAFWLFSAVMEGLEGFYEHGTNASSARGSGQVAAGRGGGGGGVDSPVVEMCKRLQGPRMQEADPELQRHLAGLDISPQVRG